MDIEALTLFVFLLQRPDWSNNSSDSIIFTRSKKIGGRDKDAVRSGGQRLYWALLADAG